MRIPLFTADWPTSFNKFSKYLGRHWPTQPLALNAAREATAYLFGYNSVHDVQRELNAEQSYSKRLDVDGMVNSMCLRGLKKFGLNPLDSTSLFRKAPWRDLALWEYTETYVNEKFMEVNKRDGMLFMLDESHLLFDYKTNEKVVDLFDKRMIPRFDYVVNDQGFIYRSGALEKLIDSIDLTAEALKEIDFLGSTQDFITDSVLPLAWVPVVDSLGSLDYRGVWRWDLPYMHEVERLGDDAYTIRHTGYNALYPGHYSFEEVKSALVSIYRNETVSPKSTGPQGDIIQIDQQSFIRPHPFEDYKPFLSNPLLSWFSIPKSAKKSNIKPDSLAIGNELYDEHLRLRSWFSTRAPVSVALKTAGSDLIKPVIDKVLAGSYRDIKSLQAEGELVPDVGADDDDYEAECKYNQGKIDEYHYSGLSALKYHPELEEYFDPVALGMEYNDFDSSGRSVNSCYKRELSFLVHVFSTRLQTLTKTRLDSGSSQYWGGRYYDPSNVGITVFSLLFENKYTLDEAMEAFKIGAGLYSKFVKQDRLITDIETFSKFKADTAKFPFASVGEPYEPTRKSSNELSSETMRLGRKFNAKSIAVVQEWPSLTTSLIESLIQK